MNVRFPSNEKELADVLRLAMEVGLVAATRLGDMAQSEVTEEGGQWVVRAVGYGLGEEAAFRLEVKK